MDDLRLICFMFKEKFKYVWLRVYLKHKLGSQERAEAMMYAINCCWYNEGDLHNVITIHNILDGRDYVRKYGLAL